jgi:tetratricopeptide (TPR) repeat protein
VLVSAALIVRDEERFLDGCLRSLDGFVDEVVVVDTGSVDGTVAIAERHGARVEHLAWTGDFGAARNRSLDLAKGEWILYVDADERLSGADPGAARVALAGPDADGVLVRLVPLVPRVGWTPYREFRLWRNRPELRFRGSMHETIVPAVAELARAEGLRIEPFDLLRIEHLGYEGDQSHKHERDVPLLLAEIERWPERVYLYDHLARVHEARGEDWLAVARWRQGIEVIRARSWPHPDDLLVYVDLIAHLLARQKVDDELGRLVDEARERFPDTPSIELAAARYAFATGRPDEALALVDPLAAVDSATFITTGSSFDRRVFDEWAWDLQGLCRFALHDFAGAAESFRSAEQAAPEVAAHGVRRRLAEARAAAQPAR